MDKVRIGGIKKSYELGLLKFGGLRAPAPFLPGICRKLAEGRINIAFLVVTGRKEEYQVSCCVAAEEAGRAFDLVGHGRGPGGTEGRLRPSVGLLSLYPTRANLNVLDLSLAALHRSALTWHALASSLSTLTFVLDYRDLEAAIEALTGVFELPSGHAPFEPEMKVFQSTALKNEE
ncbi:MAG: hypothetical protein AB1896_00550 [Thermodesulfobacteriota bacterium]